MSQLRGSRGDIILFVLSRTSWSDNELPHRITNGG